MKIIGIILLCLLVAGVCAAGNFGYQNLHWWEKDMKKLTKLGVVEKQATLPNGNVINYGELPGEGPALLLIHGQMASWEDYASVMLQLHEKWHIYAIDIYGHGESAHKEGLYYLDTNGNDIIWFIENVIKQETVVSGHSNGALLAAYIGAYGGEMVKGVFHYVDQYDMRYGEHFYDLTWNHGIKHEQMLSDIKIPCIYLHAKEEVSENGVYLCAASREQAERAVALIGDNCRLIETENSNHNIHGTHTQIYLNAINSFMKEGFE